MHTCCHVLTVLLPVNKKEYYEQQHHVQEHYREQMKAPRKRYTSRKAHEKRRISDGRQTSSDIGHHKYEKYHYVRPSRSPRVHLYDRTNHEHTRSRRPYEAGETGTYAEQDDIHSGGARHVSVQRNVSRNAVQSKQQYNECNIVVEYTFKHHIRHGTHSISYGKGYDKRRA